VLLLPGIAGWEIGDSALRIAIAPDNDRSRHAIAGGAPAGCTIASMVSFTDQASSSKPAAARLSARIKQQNGQRRPSG